MGGLQGYDLSCLEIFLDKEFIGFHLHWVERVDFGNLRGEIWVEFNGVVIGVVRGKLVMGFLREDIFKVFAPVRYNRLH